MVIQADGEKYACDACVRGHRVSSCTHKDRHLNHINKKGRPVSQCPHCRNLRKNRASHVKCVCAEVGLSREPGSCKDSAPCQCMHGQKCACAAKREALNIDNFGKVAALNTAVHRRSISKPNIVNRRSDTVLPKHQSGHHPPLHRHNHAAHDYAPYPVKRSQTTHGPLSMAQRSVDNLSLHMHSTGPGVYSTSPSSLPMTSYMDNAGALSSNSIASASVPSGLNNLAGGAGNSFMDSVPTYGSNARWSIHDFSNMSSYPTFSNEPYSAQESLSAVSDQQFNWSDWDFNAGSGPEGIQQAGSVASVEQPSLSRSSSGTASDTGESSFNPTDVAFPSMTMTTLGGTSAGWTFDSGWPLDGPGLQDKTPMAMPSQSTGSGAGIELNDYFGNYAPSADVKYSAPGATDTAGTFQTAPASAYEGSMTGMAMPQGSGWTQSPQTAGVKVENPAQGAPQYHDSSWL
ncbi:hypothetical protein FH972_022958 [Carpinus fangiana]|uniref:Copper-fist domain-containing protein n=1 Tax=Carpinus fangiana TaxID=176857 RepID=A0A5N6KU99_9ROSI|nr:hypothetical protein FH972_022958 [Carpinus fangiana]